MIGERIISGKIDIYCEHTCPRYFHALHYEDSMEVKDEMEFCGHKVSGRFALFVLGFLVDTVWLILSILNFFAGLFGRCFLKTSDERVKNDYRCENCKKEAARIDR